MDSYALCPCGSGKKVKFCCQAILPEMSKIERLQQNNQPRMALQLIEKLLKDHSDNAWLNNQRAMALIGDERFEEARDSLVAFLRKNPDNPLSNGLLALAMTELEPIGQCKKVIHRAFLKSMAAEPQIVAILAGKLVDHFMREGKEMAARQHMAVVLRLEREEERQRTLMAILEFDADTHIPYPLRGAQPLPSYEPPEDQLPVFKKAQRLYVHACFSEAADLLDQIAEKDPDSPQLWQMIGLMRAWDGDEARAAAAFHRAAQLYPNFEQAVDVETLAQLLDRRQPENTVAARARTFEVDSLSRLLTRLDNEDRLSRMPLPEGALESGVVAGYDVLDRPLPIESELGGLTLETVPRTIGQITLFDRVSDEQGPMANVNGLEGDKLDECVRIFTAAASDLAKPKAQEDGEDSDSDVLAWYSVDELSLMESLFFPPKMPNALRNRLRKESIQKVYEKTWLETPSSALQGKTPLEAAGDDSLKVPLAAALRVLDSYLDRRNILFDKEPLREKLKLPAPEPIVPTEETDINTLTVAQLERLQTKNLSDRMFDRLLHRALVVKHSGLGHRLLTEYLNDRSHLANERPEEAEQAHITLADIYSQSLRDEDALNWLQRGFEFSKNAGRPFESQLIWKMRELSLRARDPEAPEFKDLLLELWNHYGSKLPAVRARLDEFVRALEIPAPWDQAILTPQGSISSGSDAWSADTAQASTSEKKLWLPD